MNKLPDTLLAILFFALALPAYAQDYKKLEGSFSVVSATLLDPPKIESKDRIILLIDGKAAREIYDNLPGKAKKSPCSAGINMKTSGNLVCTKEAALYSCSVSLLFKSGETASAFVC